MKQEKTSAQILQNELILLPCNTLMIQIIQSQFLRHSDESEFHRRCRKEESRVVNKLINRFCGDPVPTQNRGLLSPRMHPELSGHLRRFAVTESYGEVKK